MTGITENSLISASERESLIYCSINNPIKVLHIDDEKPFLELTKLYLENISDRVRVKSASSATQFFSLIAECSYDIIISDYSMPEMNGLDLLREIRKRGVESPFILLTGENLSVITRQALHYHMINDYEYYYSQLQFHESLGIECCYQYHALNFTGVDCYLHKSGNVLDFFNELLHFINLISLKKKKHV